jgi:hypothetical protein
MLKSKFATFGGFALVIAMLAACEASPIFVVSTPTVPPAPPIVPTRQSASANETLVAMAFPSSTATETPQPSVTPTPVPSDTAAPSATTPPTEIPTATVAAPTAETTVAPTLDPTTQFNVTPDIIATDAGFEAVRYENSTSFLTADLRDFLAETDSFTDRIDDAQPFVLVPIDVKADSVLNISLERFSGTLSPMIYLLDAKGREVARSITEEGTTLATLNGITLSEDGTYVIVAGRYNGWLGESYGNFTLTYTSQEPDTDTFALISQTVGYDQVVRSEIGNVNEVIYTFSGSAGDIVNILMTATSGDLDSRVVLFDNVGNALAVNDDDYGASTLNSFIRAYPLPYNGFYSISATRYAGAATSGEFELILSSPGNTLDEGEWSLQLPVDFTNTAKLVPSTGFFSDWASGDVIDEAKNEVKSIFLATFALPPLPESFTLSSAELNIDPCAERGGGFGLLGSLTVYQDTYGELSSERDVSRPSAGARLVAEIESCAPFDVTALIEEAYAAGSSEIQFRFTFRNTPTNGESDEVLFTPSLTVRGTQSAG